MRAYTKGDRVRRIPAATGGAGGREAQTERSGGCVRRVLVSHPHGAAVASAVAAHLEREGRLALFTTGVGWARGTALAALYQSLTRLRPQLGNRLAEGVQPDHLRSLALVELGARLAGKAARQVGLKVLTHYDALFVTHDAVVAAMPWPNVTDAVYAPEDAALLTFQRAARHGLARLWELPTPHYQTQERMWLAEARRWGADPGPAEPGWKKRRKDQELARATAVVVASDFTRRSLESLNVQVPILVAPYGFPLERFPARERPPQGPFTVLSAGSQSLGKGTLYLLEAWKAAAIPDARLRLVGEMRLGPELLRRYQGLYQHVPHLPRALMYHEYQAADLLAFPTLGDGFGLVIQEAMCCGTPVVTTRCGGGPECLTDGVEGWLVPERDVEALAEVLRRAAADRDRLLEMGRAARRRAEAMTWQRAGERLLQQLDQVR